MRCGELLGQGIYSAGEAARLTGLSPQRITTWFVRHDRHRKPVFTPDLPQVSGGLRISFLDLIDVLVSGKLRDKGVSLQTIRKIHKRLADHYDERHPFCRRELLTDGARVFLKYAGQLEDHYLIDLLDNQHVFPKVILPYLDRIEYDLSTELARRWHVAEGIVVDPARSLGKPIVEAVGIPTSVLAAAYDANHRDAELVAAWYGIGADAVLHAVRFERPSAKSAA